MTTPDIFANGENENSFFNAPSGQGDGPRLVVRTVVLPPSPADTLIGMIPFNKGFILDNSSTITSDDLSTTGSLNWGFIYDDDTTFPNDTNAFVAGTAIINGGGIIRPTEDEGMDFVAEANGFIVFELIGSSTTATGNITINGIVSYQG